MSDQDAGSGPGAPPTVPPALRPLADALAALAAADLAELSDAALGEQVAGLAALVEATRGQWLRRVSAFDARAAGAADGALSTAGWLRARLRLSPRGAGAAVHLGRDLDRLPVAAAALSAGGISVEHAHAIAAAITALRPELDPDGLADAEAILVGVAKQAGPESIRRAATELRHALAPEAVIRDETERRDRRYLRIYRTFDDMIAIEGLLDPEAGELLLTALNALMRPDPPRPRPSDDQLPLHPDHADPRTHTSDADNSAGAGAGAATGTSDRAGQPPPGQPWRIGPRAGAGTDGLGIRTAAQRRADALTELAQLVLAGRATPTVHGLRPHASVIVNLDTLQAPRGEPGHPPARLNWTGPISGEAARRRCCDAGITRVVTDGASLPLDIGRTTRAVPGWLFLALALRDGGCAFPGCDRPPEWTHAHHIVHWARGGPTALLNLVLLCVRHHHAVHEGGWAVTMTPAGRPAFAPPERQPTRTAA